MILVLSKNESEKSTNIVIDYLKTKNVKFYRLNGDDLVSKQVAINFYISNQTNKWEFEIIDGNFKIHSSEVKCVWFRRNFSINTFNFVANNPKLNRINDFLLSELFSIYSLIEVCLEDVFWLNSISKSTNKKLLYLQKAKQFGLSVPISFISNNRAYISNKLDFANYITKPTTEGFFYEFDTNNKFNITVERINKIPSEDFFFPSFCQEEIKSEYEIRVFFLMNKVYAIQMDNKNEKEKNVDIRDSYKLFRSSKYTLPTEIEKKIVLFMNDIGLNSGSLDLIRDEIGNYWFIEVNPVGQFDKVSIVGNYNLELKIADILYEKSK